MTESIESNLLSRCEQIATSTWSDALDHLGLGGVVRGLTQRSGSSRFAGFAVTVKETVGELGSYTKSDLSVGRIIDATGPQKVLMIDMGRAEVSTFGGIAAAATRRRGGTAVVIDGACRDIEEISATGLWLASRHVTPITGKGRVKIEALNEPVVIGGVSVQPGDLVVGDATGIVVIAKAEVSRVMARVEQVLAADRDLQIAIDGGGSSR